MARIATALMVVLAPLAAGAQPKLSADMPVDTAVTDAPGLLDQQHAAVAIGNGSFFAVWAEGDRAGTNPARPWTLKGARLSQTGALMDDPPLTIVKGVVQTPAVAWDGTQWVVVWQDAASNDIDAVRISATGVIGTSFMIGSGTLGGASMPVVAGGGGNALAAWMKLGSPPQIHAALLDATSIVKSEFQVSAATSSESPDGPTVAWGGGTNGFLVAWQDFNSAATPTQTYNIFAARVSTTGTVTAVAGALNGDTSQHVDDPTATFDGTNYVVAWQDSRTSGLPDVWMRTISLTGTPSAADFAMATPPLTGTDFYFRPQIAMSSKPTGGAVVGVFEDLLYAAGPAVLTGGRFPSVSGGMQPETVNGVALTTMLQSSPAQNALPSMDADSRRSALASDGSHAMLVWTAQADSAVVTGNDVFAMPIDLTASGALAMPASKLLATGPNFQNNVQIATNGSVFLAVWTDDRTYRWNLLDVYGQRYDHKGVPIDAQPILLGGGAGDQFLPSVAASQNGGDFLVVWSDGTQEATNCPPNCFQRIGGVRLASTGAPMALSGPIGASTHAQLSPSVASSGNGWLVAWEDWRDIPSSIPYPGIYATPISAAGTVGTEIAVASPQSDMTKIACAASVAWDGANYLVAYEQPCGQYVGTNYLPFMSNPPARVLGKWVAQDGTVNATAVTIAQTTLIESAPALTADGNGGVLAAWREQSGTTGDAIHVGRLTDLATGPTAVTVATGGQGLRLSPSIAAGGGVVLVSWIDTLLTASNNPGVTAARLDGSSLATLDSPFTLVSMPTWPGPIATPAAVPQSGAGVGAVPRSTPPASVAAMATGEAMAAYNLKATITGTDLPRVHVLALGLGGNGETCSGAEQCSLGICAGTTCCNTACDGVCQACGKSGCIDTPKNDTRCGAPDGGTIDCGQLSTECRTFAAQPAGRCVAFGQCGEPAGLEDCITYSDKPDGTACTGGCAMAGTCMGGECRCPGGTTMFQPRINPPGSGGCSVGGTGEPAAIGLVLIALFALVRRRARLALLALIAGCSSSGTALVLELKIEPAAFTATSTAQVVIRSTDGYAFPPASPSQPVAGLTLSNYDWDGDGLTDIVLDFASTYPLHQTASTEDKTNRLKLLPSTVTRPIHLDVLCNLFDGFGNRLASDEAMPTLTPGQSTLQQLAPHCVDGGSCTSSTVALNASAAAMTAPPIELPAGAGKIRALAVGDLTGAGKRGDLIVASTARADSDGGLNAGAVTVYFGAAGHFPSTAGATINGASGEALGSAVAVGDFDGDGKDDLFLGAPEAHDGAGAIYFVKGRAAADWTATMSSGDTGVLSVQGAKPGDRLGEALLVADADGNGKLELWAGAPGAAAVYQLTTTGDFTNAAIAKSASMSGPAGSEFGRALAGTKGFVAAGAPGEGAAYLAAGATPSSAKRWHGAGGGFGTALGFLSDGGKPLLAVGAPNEAGGAVYLQPADSFADALSGSTVRSIHANAPLGQLGASIARLGSPQGDLLLAGAPARLGAGSNGAALAIHTATMTAVPAMTVGADGKPAAGLILDDVANEGLGSAIAVGDFNQDGVDDLAVATADVNKVYLIPTPRF
jgi:MYXO-CTERM domain-containing protein